MQQGNEGPKLSTSTGPNGEFQFKSLDPSRTGLKLEASTADARTEKPFDVSPALHAPVVLTIRSGNLVSLNGRVVCRTGQPVEGAELELWSQEWEYSDPARLLVGGAILHTDSDGRFATPRQFRVDHRYKVKVGGPGLSTNWSDWTRFRAGEAARFPDLVVDRPKPINGRVTDQSGQPVAKAEICLVSDYPARPRTQSDEHGSFRIELPASGTITIFAEARGFRIQGRLIKPTAEQCGTGPEPHERDRTPDAQDLGPHHARRRATAAGVEGARAGYPACPNRPRRGNGIPHASTAGPDRPNSRSRGCRKGKFTESMMREGVKAYAARSLMKDTPDEAMALIESLEDPIGRTNGYRQASDLLPASERDKKRALLSLGLVHAQGIKDPACG